MSITDELRAYTEKQIKWLDMTKVHYRKLFAIADRIDAEHEKAAAGCIHYDQERHYCSVHGDTENGWIRLPKDADGEPIRVGDVMEWCDPDGEVTVTCEVDAVGVECFFAWDGANGRYAQKCANAYRHHHPPTVEDVLLEACKAYHGLMVESMSDVAHDMPAPSEVIAEYAAKLRLAGEAE